MFAAAPSSSRWKTTSLPPANLTAAARQHAGVAALVIGMTVDEAIRRLKGIQCRNGTSCPDQLATALEEYKANHAA